VHEVTGWAAAEPGAPLRPWRFARRDPAERDVVVRITYCGVCATDLHSLAHGDPSVFPLVAGHEMVGEVVAVGSAVTRFAAGDGVAIGNIVGSCRVCTACRAGRESMCEQYPTLTYSGPDPVSGGTTQGGFSTEYVADEHFVYPLPRGLDPAAVAPLLCAGITTWAPLRRYGVGPGTTVGVVGLGGLGHVAVKFSHALGAETVVFTSSEHKADDARALGADDVVVTRDEQRMRAQHRRCDLVLDTTGAAFDRGPYLDALALDGTLVLAGIPPEPLTVDPMSLIVGEHRLAGTGSGGVPATAEMLDFCAEHGLTADVEVVKPDGLDDALARLARGDVRYRFVVDVSG
jgi:alcohol dehydrogenase (NADP+)